MYTVSKSVTPNMQSVVELKHVSLLENTPEASQIISKICEQKSVCMKERFSYVQFGIRGAINHTKKFKCSEKLSISDVLQMLIVCIQSDDVLSTMHNCAISSVRFERDITKEFSSVAKKLNIPVELEKSIIEYSVNPVLYVKAVTTRASSPCRFYSLY